VLKNAFLHEKLESSLLRENYLLHTCRSDIAAGAMLDDDCPGATIVWRSAASLRNVNSLAGYVVEMSTSIFTPGWHLTETIVR
jgi:hypothetical protein